MIMTKKRGPRIKGMERLTLWEHKEFIMPDGIVWQEHCRLIVAELLGKGQAATVVVWPDDPNHIAVYYCPKLPVQGELLGKDTPFNLAGPKTLAPVQNVNPSGRAGIGWAICR